MGTNADIQPQKLHLQLFKQKPYIQTHPTPNPKHLAYLHLHHASAQAAHYLLTPTSKQVNFIPNQAQFHITTINNKSYRPPQALNNLPRYATRLPKRPAPSSPGTHSSRVKHRSTNASTLAT